MPNARRSEAKTPSGLHRLARTLGLLGVAFALSAAALAAGWMRWALAPVAAPAVATADPMAFSIEPGRPLGAIARDLEDRGLIRSALALRLFARWHAIETALKVGEYELSPAMSTSEIAEILASGRVRTHPVVLPEGIRASEIADRLAAAGLADRDAFLEVVFDPDSAHRFEVEGPTLEGYLFPDTYRFAKGLEAEEIAQAMVERFRAVYDEVRADTPRPGASEKSRFATRSASRPAATETLAAAARRAENATALAASLPMREFVTLASIVEKETGAPDERPLIAAVFLNRMRLGMRLETDPTVIYGIAEFDGNLRRIHLEDESNPYNTYRIPGLPPGPIANPGRDALAAVLAPADSPYLFFVSRNDGTHVFSKSYREHTRAVVHFQKQRRRR